MRKTLTICRLFMIALAVISAACDKPPLLAPSNLPHPNLSRTVRLEISGPSEMAPASTTKFQAMAHLDDGSSHDVTDKVSWASLNTGALTVNGGVVTASPQPGEGQIRVVLHPHIVAHTVIVVPPGTYRLTGVVTESGSNGYGVSGARVDVVSTAGTVGAVTAGGQYRIYGVAGATRVSVTKAGYEVRELSMNVIAHERLDVELPPSTTRPSVGGSYAVTIAAAEACRDQLPPELMSRRYSATVTQSGPRVTVILDGATFAAGIGRPQNRFSGSVESGDLELQLNDFDEDPSCSFGPTHECYVLGEVLEHITELNYFNPTGKASIPLGAPVLSGALRGTLYARRLNAGKFPPTASCTSEAHRIEMRRQ
jgi:hypothetical protein